MTKERWCKNLSETKEQKERWSYSRTACFANCKYEYYLKYILKDDEMYLPEGNYYSEVGSFMHDILAKIFDKELTLDNALMYFVENFDDNVLYKTRYSTMEKTFEICTDYFAEVDFDWLDNYEVVGVEKELHFTLGDYDFICYIDLLLKDKRDGKYVIIDHKSVEYPYIKGTKKPKKRCIHNLTTYTNQMYLYAHAVKQNYGDFPKEMTWNHFKDEGKLATIDFEESIYDEIMDWYIKTIHEAENEKEFLPTYNWFYCNVLCNYRNSCEYQLENRG